VMRNLQVERGKQGRKFGHALLQPTVVQLLDVAEPALSLWWQARAFFGIGTKVP